MNKYKFAIQVSTPVDEILKLDYVVGVRKCNGDLIFIEGGYPYHVCKWLEYDLADGSVAKQDDWLVQDVCDNWHMMKDEYYQLHKNDQI